MSSMLEQLWPVFLAEVSEKLDTVETLIINTNNNSTNIDALFREFHTLKSSFSMVDFQMPMELAHACEDVLHGMRKTNDIPNENIRKYLLEAIDWIKQQLAIASPGQYPQQANETLLAQLAPFRVMEDEFSAEESFQTQKTDFDEKEALAAKKMAEEKEALSVDTLRINSYSLDNLVTNVSQLALKENSLSNTIHDERINHTLTKARQQLQRLRAGENVNTDAISELLQIFTQYRQELTQADVSIQATIDIIQQEVMDLRVIPLSTIFNRLPRIIRQKANAAGKQVQLIIEGGDLSIDKGMIEIISEPLIHLLHNAVTHGIETTQERQALGKPDMSRISILANEKNNLLHIEVIDDGRGIDYLKIREKAILQGLAKENDEHQEPEYWLNFLFLYGMSTSHANRATGLDIVRNQLSSIGGSISIQSKPDNGTRFVMRMPVTVAIQSAILVMASTQTFAIPSRYLTEIIEVPHDNLQTMQNQVAIDLRGNMLPVYHLEKLLTLDKACQNSEISSTLMLLILQNDNHSIALAIDNVLGKQEFFLRDIHPDLRNIPGIGGISLLGNGNAVIILDCDNLFALAKNHA